MKTWIRDDVPTLFDHIPAEEPTGSVRQTVIDAALLKARAEWRERYTQFILEFAEKAVDPFTAEDVREAYLATPGLPHTDKEQASGGIFQQLVKHRKLHPSGHLRSKKFGNWLQAYLKG